MSLRLRYERDVSFFRHELVSLAVVSIPLPGFGIERPCLSVAVPVMFERCFGFRVMFRVRLEFRAFELIAVEFSLNKICTSTFESGT